MNGDVRALIGSETKIKVSSTLDKSVGKKYLTDGSPETCWTSQQGIPQYIQLSFHSPVVPRRIAITFQGGFVGTRCAIQIALHAGTDTDRSEWVELVHIFPEDVNRMQSFELPPIGPDIAQRGVGGLRLVFEESSDFFGRITVYDLKIEGVIL